MSDFSTPPGWYPDGDGWERRWDGSSWTEERRRMGGPTPPTKVRTTPPPAAPPAGPPPGQAPAQAPAQQGWAPGHVYGHIPSNPTPTNPHPAAFGGYGGPQGSPYGGYPPAGPPRKSKLWLWITLAVVLVLALGTGVTLAALQPWKDDDKSAGRGEDPNGGDGGEGNQATQGDVTGDNLGDAVYQLSFSYDNVKEVTATSNGNGFETKELAVDPYRAPNDMYFDWDTDGVNEKLTWSFVGSGDQITLSSSDGDFPGEQTHTGYYGGDRGYALLKSSGKNFELGAISETTEYKDVWLVGDVTGDGTDHLVGVETNSHDEEIIVQVYDVSGGTLKEVAGFTGTSKVGRRYLQGAALSDVDGDGDGDVVFVVKGHEETKFTGVQVMKSTGSVFEAATVWAETPPCQDDRCRIEFPKLQPR